MQRVKAVDIREFEPLPYDVYDADGVMLLAKGQMVPSRKHAAILRAQAWRLSEGEDRVSPSPTPPSAASSPVLLSLDVHLPARGRPTLPHAAVLIADDVPLVRQLLTSMLREQGIQKIDTVDNGRVAVSHFFRHQPHLVFLDIDMPFIDGLDVLCQIKRWSPETFVCMVSGNSTLMNLQEAKACGVDAFLVKPLSRLNLQRVLKKFNM
jgi:CheY-like chemotaxis protein